MSGEHELTTPPPPPDYEIMIAMPVVRIDILVCMISCAKLDRRVRSLYYISKPNIFQVD